LARCITGQTYQFQVDHTVPTDANTVNTSGSTLSATGNDTVSSTGTFGGSISQSSSESFSDATLTAPGMTEDNNAVSSDQMLRALYATANRGPGQYLSLFRSVLRASDGTFLPLSASKTFKFAAPALQTLLYGTPP
jgi:hypothetical protein